MYFEEIDFGKLKRKMFKCADYESDCNTVRIGNRYLYSMADVAGDNALSNLAVMPCGNDYYRLYFKLGVLFYAYCYITKYTDKEIIFDELKKFAEKINIEWHIDGVLTTMERGLHIRKLDLIPLKEFGEIELLEECIAYNEEYKRRKGEEEKERHKAYLEKLAENKRKEEEDIAAAKKETVERMLSLERIDNKEVHYKNIIILLCEDAGIKIPLRTKGYMMDAGKFGAAKFAEDGTVTIWRDKKYKSETIFGILEEMFSYYKNGTTEDGGALDAVNKMGGF